MTKHFKNQQDRDAHNARELGYIADYLFEKTQSADASSAVIAAVSDYLKNKQMALDVDDYTLELKGLLYKIVRDRKQNTLKAMLDKWTAGYPAAVEKARQQGEQNRQQHADQPHGIYRGLTEKGIIDYKAWGEDLDILVALRRVKTDDPASIQSDGAYILSPVSLDEQGALETKVQEFCAANPEKDLTLLIPVNKGQNHWQLVIVDVVEGEVIDHRIWDSIKAGVQKNGYSCMDFVIREALRIKFANQVPEQSLQAIMKAKNALTLREAIVNRILNVHQKMQNNQSLHESVQLQVERRPEVEKFRDISEDDEDKLHAELIKNKDIQEEFDASMATMLKDLYEADNNTNKTDIELYSVARKFAYQELLKKYGLFSEPSTSASSQENRLRKRL